MKAAEEIYPLVELFGEYFAKRDFVGANQELIDIDLTIDECELVCYIRTTYPARHHLPDWQETVYRVHGELLKRGYDADHLCRGLM